MIPLVVGPAVQDIRIVIIDGDSTDTVGAHAGPVTGTGLEVDELSAVEPVETIPCRDPDKTIPVLQQLREMLTGDTVVLAVAHPLRNRRGCEAKTEEQSDDKSPLE